MSTGDTNPASADSSADEPAALAPDDTTAVHDVPAPAEEAAATEEVASGEGATPAPPAPEALPMPPEEPTPAPESARVIEPAATAPSPDHQAASGAGVTPDPQVTSSGLPNPYGLPEVAVERPEVAIGAAFAGGLVLAMILKRLAR